MSSVPAQHAHRWKPALLRMLERRDTSKYSFYVRILALDIAYRSGGLLMSDVKIHSKSGVLAVSGHEAKVLDRGIEVPR